MKYILTMISDYSAWARMTPEESQAFEQRLNALNDELKNAGAWVSAEGMGDPAEGRSVRFTTGSSSVTDGPYVNGHEQLGGFWIVDVPSIDEAVGWAQKVPLANGAIEIRALA
jgi:hypothetical protein